MYFLTYFAQKVAYIVLFICVNYVPYFEDNNTIETVQFSKAKLARKSIEEDEQQHDLNQLLRAAPSVGGVNLSASLPFLSKLVLFNF